MVQCIQSQSEMNGHDFGHEFLDTDTRFFWTSDTDMGRVMTSDTDTGSDTHVSENLGHGFGLGHDFGYACPLISGMARAFP